MPTLPRPVAKVNKQKQGSPSPPFNPNTNSTMNRASGAPSPPFQPPGMNTNDTPGGQVIGGTPTLGGVMPGVATPTTPTAPAPPRTWYGSTPQGSPNQSVSGGSSNWVANNQRPMGGSGAPNPSGPGPKDGGSGQNPQDPNGGGAPAPKPTVPGPNGGVGPEGGLDANGVWHPPSPEYLAGLANGTIAPKWAGQPGSPEYQQWENWKAWKASQGGGQNPPPPASTPPPPTTQQNNHPNHGHPPRNNQPGMSQQNIQAGNQALFNNNTIPHDLKLQLSQLAAGGNMQAFNQALFNSALPQDLKMQLMGIYGGTPAPGPQQSSTPDQGVNQAPAPPPAAAVPRVPFRGSPYYGAV